MKKSFKKYLRKVLKQRLKTLPRNVRFTARQIYGSAVWNSLTKGERLNAGSYLASRVRRNKVPLYYVDRTSSNHRQYKRL